MRKFDKSDLRLSEVGHESPLFLPFRAAFIFRAFLLISGFYQQRSDRLWLFSAHLANRIVSLPLMSQFMSLLTL